MKKIKVPSARVIIFFAAVLLLLILTFSISWTKRNFNNVRFDEIVFNLSMPLEGTAGQVLLSFLIGVVGSAIGVLAEIIAGLFLFRMFLEMKPGFREKLGWIRAHWMQAGTVCLVLWAAGILWTADRSFGLASYIRNRFETSALIEEEYVDPGRVNITFPDEKKNLIYILVESGETSSQDVASGGLMKVNYTPEMTAIAEEGISFSQSELLVGAAVSPSCSWTMGGMVAESAGLPLKLFSGGNNSMRQHESFMPSVVTLGDILADAGYHNVFMAGSDFSFGGRRNYCTSHGDYEILDYLVAQERGIIPQGYKVWWGFEDWRLYEWAKEELLELAESSQPFNFTMLTVDTHAQDGYYCNLCHNQYRDQYANVWRCASEQLGEFVAWIEEQDFYPNTTVVILGDHCSMDIDFYPETDGGSEIIFGRAGEQLLQEREENGEISGTQENLSDQAEDTEGNVRGVYNVFLNAAQSGSAGASFREKNRKFTTLDFFPTILSSMGAEIEGNRLGLGTNLFSDEQTLAEKYGYEYLFSELAKRSVFYEKEIMFVK